MPLKSAHNEHEIWAIRASVFNCIRVLKSERTRARAPASTHARAKHLTPQVRRGESEQQHCRMASSLRSLPYRQTKPARCFIFLFNCPSCCISAFSLLSMVTCLQHGCLSLPLSYAYLSLFVVPHPLLRSVRSVTPLEMSAPPSSFAAVSSSASSGRMIDTS